MPARLINGKAIARTVRADLKDRVVKLAERGVIPGLSVVIVGEDPASKVYVNNKIRACEEVGIASRVYRLPEDVPQADVERLLNTLNRDDTVHGIIVQLPLPPHLDEATLVDAVIPAKDVDGFHPENMGRLLRGEEGFRPCTPLGIMHLLSASGVNVAGKRAVVVGRGNVGRPLSLMLMAADATVTICHSRTVDLASVTRQGDVLVAAAGRAGLITGPMVKPGAVVVDVGIHRKQEGGLIGDVDFASVREVAGWITPVPGGVGPMTVAMLLVNTICAAERDNRAD